LTALRWHCAVRTFRARPAGGRFADEKSFMDYLILNEVSKNVDGYRLSTYFHKDRDDRGGKLKMGPPVGL
jgi:hypothetical protein